MVAVYRSDSVSAKYCLPIIRLQVAGDLFPLWQFGKYQCPSWSCEFISLVLSPPLALSSLPSPTSSFLTALGLMKMSSHSVFASMQ